MTVYSIWESWFAADTSEEGIEATEAIWEDMRSFAGYVSHELVQDLDEPGHLFVLAQWDSREAADAALSYSSHPNVERVERLVSRPRRRAVAAAP